MQAAIAAVHDTAGRAEDTDWRQIVALYEVLEQMVDNPMVKLNHAVAVAMAAGPKEGLDVLEPLESDDRMAGHHRLEAVRAHLLEMAGDPTPPRRTTGPPPLCALTPATPEQRPAPDGQGVPTGPVTRWPVTR